MLVSASDSVFFLGMGTGITAGEALNRDDFKHIEKVVTCELSPSVVAASKKYFTGKMGGPDLTNGVYDDPRSLHQSAENGKPHFVGDKFADLVDKIQLRTPPDSDPLLASRSPSSRELVLAGSAFHRGSIACALGDEMKWDEYWQQFLKHWINLNQ